MLTETRESAAAASGTPSPALRLLLESARHQRRLVAACALGVALTATALAILLPNLYTASVVIFPPQSSSASAAMLAQMSNLSMLGSMGGGLGIKNPNDMQVALLKSRTVEDAMVERFHLQAEYHKRLLSSARARWEKTTAVDNGLKDGLIRISVTDHDARRAAELASGWLDEYRRLTASLAITEASQRRLFYERELNGARGELIRAEDALKETEQRTGVLEIDGQAKALIASAAMLHGQVAAKQVEIRAMREFATSENPDLERAEQELSSMESQAAAMDLNSEHASGDLISPKGKLTQASLDYTRAVREVRFREAMVEVFTRQYAVARVDEARQGALVQVVDPAVVPDRPSSHYKIWIFAGGMVLALPLALALAWMVEAAAAARRWRSHWGGWTAVLEQVLAREER